MSKKPVILFFVDGFVASPEELSQGGNIPNATVHYRNAQQVAYDENPEPCDGVFGAVPPSYKHLPSAKEAVAKYEESLQAKKKASGDVEAPKPSPGAKKPYEKREASVAEKSK